MDSVDLNLLAALDALLAEGSVTAAARRLGLSASAMSRTLARLRAATGDPLLVRAGRGLVPTPRAMEMRDRVHLLTRDVRTVLSPQAGQLDVARADDLGVRLEVGKETPDTAGVKCLRRRAGATRLRLRGIEPRIPAWKAGVLPLNYARGRRRNIAHVPEGVKPPPGVAIGPDLARGLLTGTARCRSRTKRSS